MIFNTFAYFFCFLVPAAVMFRLSRPWLKPWVCFAFGAAFFIFFSLTEVGGVVGAACLLLFLWESLFSRLYKPGSVLCLIGVVQAVALLAVFKYWNFFTGLIFGSAEKNPVFWTGAFLPLGVSFFTFEFVHYAVDRYRGTAPAGRFRDYFAFILFFPTMVAGPIKRYQDFGPKLENPSLAWDEDCEEVRGRGSAHGVHRSLELRRHRAGAALGVAGVVAGLRDQNLLRLLGLLGHRDRFGPAVWDQGAGELRLALHPYEHRVFLAALAHVAVPVVGGLCVHPTRRITYNGAPRLLERGDHDGDQRAVARRGP
jgi:hypothetical protein